MVASINRKARGHNCIFKLDMMKAFDRVSWGFLRRLLQKFGFDYRFILLILNNLSQSWFFVLVNGRSRGFFQASRGIKQGDPLSPILFILASEALSRGLNALVEGGSVAPYAMPRGCTSITHLAFADDIVIFARGDRRSVGNLLRFLTLYQNGAGQRINKQKSFFIASKRCGAGQIRQIQHLTGFRHGSFPFSYLGCNLYAGHRKKEYFHFLIEKFVAKLAGWQKKLLTQGGRLILIKHVLSAIPLHVLAVMDPPKAVIHSLERLMARFFWGQSEFGPKHHWCSWKNLCYPTAEDGLGLRCFEDIQGAFSCKLWWRYCNSKSLWADFMRSRYSVHSGAQQAASRVWRRMLAVRDTVDQFTQVIKLDDTVRRAWVLTASGEFTVSLAWDAMRPQQADLGSRRCIWDCWLPCKISIFMWKLLNNYLPFPEALRRFGFQLPSKCQFCPTRESQDHVLSDCSLATEVWNFFSRVLRIPIQPSNGVVCRLQQWWLYKSQSTARGELCRVLASIISWGLWKARNVAMYEGVRLTPTQVCRNIQALLLSISQSHPFVQMAHNDRELVQSGLLLSMTQKR
ncbi:uncharacterized protein LOC113767379 [Coffea eugenioides]|uniref:uncharacterized protein LOC113767379 n=1 Tax=Coffea eugenioides TaxID=49369 RepID=UPI000F61557A|nr:uncharacterized protein LOC113767379 [Coffea eugenioides]